MFKEQPTTLPNPSVLLRLTGTLTAALALSACIGGSSSSNTDNESGSSPEIAAAEDIYDGDYAGPTDRVVIDDATVGAATMDLTYLSWRAQKVLASIEQRTSENLQDPDSTGPETVAGDCPNGFDSNEDGNVTFEEVSDPETPPNNGTVTITSTYTFNDYCIEKMNTGGDLPGGQLLIRSASEPYVVKETTTFVDGQAETVEVEATVENLVFAMRGSEYEMSGTEVVLAQDGENAGALAFDVEFSGDSAEQPTTWRFLADLENDLTAEGNIREVELASELLGGSVKTVQEGISNFFDGFDCTDGLFGSTYAEPQQGKVTLIYANDKELVANLSEHQACEQYVLSGNPEGNFTLLNTLFEGP